MEKISSPCKRSRINASDSNFTGGDLGDYDEYDGYGYQQMRKMIRSLNSDDNLWCRTVPILWTRRELQSRQ